MIGHITDKRQMDYYAHVLRAQQQHVLQFQGMYYNPGVYYHQDADSESDRTGSIEEWRQDAARECQPGSSASASSSSCEIESEEGGSTATTRKPSGATDSLLKRIKTARVNVKRAEDKVQKMREQYPRRYEAIKEKFNAKNRAVSVTFVVREKQERENLQWFDEQKRKLSVELEIADAAVLARVAQYDELVKF
jgi:hypothetical protein